MGTWALVVSPHCLTTIMLGGLVSYLGGEANLWAMKLPLPFQSSGFGWFSWFRSKPTSVVSPSGDEDSSDSPDSEVASLGDGKPPPLWAFR